MGDSTATSSRPRVRFPSPYRPAGSAASGSRSAGTPSTGTNGFDATTNRRGTGDTTARPSAGRTSGSNATRFPSSSVSGRSVDSTGISNGRNSRRTTAPRTVDRYRDARAAGRDATRPDTTPRHTTRRAAPSEPRNGASIGGARTTTAPRRAGAPGSTGNRYGRGPRARDAEPRTVTPTKSAAKDGRRKGSATKPLDPKAYGETRAELRRLAGENPTLVDEIRTRSRTIGRTAEVGVGTAVGSITGVYPGLYRGNNYRSGYYSGSLPSYYYPWGYSYSRGSYFSFHLALNFGHSYFYSPCYWTWWPFYLSCYTPYYYSYRSYWCSPYRPSYFERRSTGDSTPRRPMTGSSTRPSSRRPP